MRPSTVRTTAVMGILGGLLLLPPGGSVAEEEPLTRRGDVLVTSINGVISAINAELAADAVRRAEQERFALVVFEVNTPGGLMTSMDAIIQTILGSEVPVSVFVTPAGAQATSAGLYITNAADIAAMTPGTKIGAGHPVMADGGNPGGEEEEGKRNFMNEKVENTAAAGVRSIATNRGRNAEVYEKMVRESISLTAREALDQSVVDILADDLYELITTLDGREITRFDGTRERLELTDARLERLEMTPRQRILFWVTDPRIAFLLVGIGVLGLYIEFNNPGLIVPGAIGALSLILFAISTQILPVNLFGAVLIVLAVVLFILELNVTSYGLLSLGGVVALTLGFLTLFDVESIPALRPSLGFILPTSLTIGLIMAFVTSLALAAQRVRVVTGKEGLSGETGEAVTDIAGGGKVFVHGEYWEATSRQPIAQGARVKIKSVSNMVLEVEPADPHVEEQS